jgi:glycerol-3-phosphate dehydrogenase (NAD(P)+)
MKMVAEGVWNSRVVHELSADLGVEMPISEMVYALCHDGMDARKAVALMMGRELKAE